MKGSVSLIVVGLTVSVHGFGVLASPRTVVSARVGGAPDLPLAHPRLQPPPGRTTEQVHVTAGVDGTSLHITWSANGSAHAPVTAKVMYTVAGSSYSWTVAEGPPGAVYSTLLDPRYPKEEGGCEGSANYTNEDCFYTSLAVYTVLLTGLHPSTRYTFRTGADEANFTVRTLPGASSPRVRFGVVGDLGQTTNSTATIDAMHKLAASGSIDGVLHAGDLSYADGNGYRWDSYGRLMEPLATLVPFAHVGGNHEVSNGGENWVAYLARYPNSYREVGSSSGLWWSFKTGPAHVLMLCSYADTSPGSAQYAWLARELASVDRQATPWLIVVVHTPMYTSNSHHPMAEGAKLRTHLEPLLLAAGADLLLNGHVHAYERTLRVADLRIAPHSGIAHITIGDGGNREHFATPWTDAQPEWSALREFAYGYGVLDLNRTHATWTWMRNNDPWNPPGGLVGDTATYTSRPLADRSASAAP